MPIDNLKLKKTLKLIGVELTGTVAWNLHSKTCIAKYSCKDRILRGKLFFNLRDRAIEYRQVAGGHAMEKQQPGCVL
ncbi:uncharacterized protein HaLaN_23907, partial [Haematococcus lacustris]